MYDIPATKERHRTLGLARSHPNEAKRTFRYTDDFHSTSTSLLIPTITQTNPSPPHHPITPSPHHPSIIHHPSPTHPPPIYPSTHHLQTLSLSPPLVLLFRCPRNQHCQLSIVPVLCSPAYCPASEPLSTLRAGWLGNQSIACDNGKTTQSPIAITVPGRSSLPRSQDF